MSDRARRSRVAPDERPRDLMSTRKHSSCVVPAGADACGKPVVPGCPVPLCVTHLSSAFEFARGAGPCGSNAARQRRRRLLLRIGPLIKIGHSVDLKARLGAYPPDAVVLATERGDGRREMARHQQFAAHRASGREWYHPNDALVDHIADLRRGAHEQDADGMIATDEVADLARYLK